VLFSLKGTREVVSMRENREGLTELELGKVKLEARLAKADRDDKEDIERSLHRVDVKMAAIRHVYGDSTDRKLDDDEMTEAIMQNLSDSLLLPNLSPSARERISKKVKSGKEDDDLSPSFFGLNQGNYKTVEAYDSAEAKLPEDMRDGWLKRMATRKAIHLQMEYHEDKRGFQEHLKENILHSFPKILFVTLPIFALLLNILYFRHKQYYYVDHGIFTIHVYCATFILLLLFILLQKIASAIGVAWVQVIFYILATGIWVYILIYLYKAMRGFYKQGRMKTFIKYFIICCLSFIVNIFLFMLFILISVVSL
jgi:hypothetical protein